MRLLWITNDLPPRAGGIERFVIELVRRIDPHEAFVIGPDQGPAAVRADEDERHRTLRLPGGVHPTPATLRRIVEVARSHRPDVLILGAAWPLGELARPLHQALDRPIVALSHGLEAGLVGAGLGPLLRRSTVGLSAMTTISRFTADRLRPHVATDEVHPLPPGVDITRFTPEVDGDGLRRRLGLPVAAPVVACVSRLVARKGQDRLLDAWPAIRAAHPEAWLLLAGTGPEERRLRRRCDALGPGAQVVMPGRLAWSDLPAAHAAADVFAMPCRTRLGGLDVEGLGIVYLEAQAAGVPVVAGRSGGAPEAVGGADSGSIVDGRDPRAIATAVVGWLDDAEARRGARLAGPAFVRAHHGWDRLAERFATIVERTTA